MKKKNATDWVPRIDLESHHNQPQQNTKQKNFQKYFWSWKFRAELFLVFAKLLWLFEKLFCLLLYVGISSTHLRLLLHNRNTALIESTECDAYNSKKWV